MCEQRAMQQEEAEQQPGVISFCFRATMLLLICGLLNSRPAAAQDLHFSQWFNSPLLTNPANTGFIPDADYRLGANYRNQWSNVMSIPYKTMSVWGDAQVYRSRIESGWLGLGGVILRDVAGSSQLTSTKVYVSAAYHQMIGIAHLLSAGFNVGWSNKRINTSALKFPDQFDGKFFDSNFPSDGIPEATSVNYFDVQLGVNYAFFPTDKIYVNGGVSAMHINRPRESFFNTDPTGYDSRISPRYNGFVNASLKLTEDVILNPMAYYSLQAKSNELVAGAYAQYNLSGEGGEMQVLGGLYYRAGDAFVPMIGFEYKNIRLTFTYDATTSSLKQYNNSRGAYEFALTHRGYYDEYNGDRRQSLCPTF
ncbi:PorP/SprF family type IX secretion system membrane protein [Paraflavitalea sp. CAU 1676]|uniref:PorP/SprF family type IX secretion system membrane protein n=1 Tax=Paraflavitalea sp. CAU 1676 TaxID=3032598 RepID=UPI0023DB098E|nr:PorP/SprF family type IX secretion system membrane protein [Paraflavitalea sp. CAU 1676]MDF2187613.1 PorP/SprF family type IX secretion system membrane protein [Paraflavitalea sp. CAU 1676]